VVFNGMFKVTKEGKDGGGGREIPREKTNELLYPYKTSSFLKVSYVEDKAAGEKRQCEKRDV